MKYIKDEHYPKAKVSTGNGVVEGILVTLDSFEALGRKVHNFEVFAYDFLQTGSIEIYDGMIGLDFLHQTRHHIDLIENYIELINY